MTQHQSLKPSRTPLILITIVCILGGLLLIYRAQQTVENLFQFRGTVNKLTINSFPSSKSGLGYSLDFVLAETDKIYGIYLGTKDQADQNELKSRIEIGQTYTFYIDQSVLPSMNGHTLGIKAIKHKNETLFRDNPKVDYIGGGIFLTLGILAGFALIYGNKRMKNAL